MQMQLRLARMFTPDESIVALLWNCKLLRSYSTSGFMELFALERLLLAGILLSASAARACRS
jgi:hypothetical protein